MPGTCTSECKTHVHLKAPQVSESKAPRALTGYEWMGLLHVRGVLIPTLNELANGSPFTLTPFPHTFTHQALLAYPPGHRRQGGNSLTRSQPYSLALSLTFLLMFKRHIPNFFELLSCVFQACR